MLLTRGAEGRERALMEGGREDWISLIMMHSPAALSLVGGREGGERSCCVQEQRAHSPRSSQRGRTDGRTDGGREAGSGRSYAAFSHKHTRIAGRVCADARGDVLRVDAFVRAPPPVQHPAGDRVEARPPQES